MDTLHAELVYDLATELLRATLMTESERLQCYGTEGVQLMQGRMTELLDRR